MAQVHANHLHTHEAVRIMLVQPCNTPLDINLYHLEYSSQCMAM